MSLAKPRRQNKHPFLLEQLYENYLSELIKALEIKLTIPSVVRIRYCQKGSYIMN
jgi:hypothetical protein